jgi:hypothetical protein
LPEAKPEYPSLRRYMIRFSEEAKLNAIEEAHTLFRFTGNKEDGIALYDDFFAHAATLTELPDRQPVLRKESKRLGVEVRRLIVRSRFHLVYQIEDADDGPMVRIVYIRSGYKKPLGDEEARRIMENQ